MSTTKRESYYTQRRSISMSTMVSTWNAMVTGSFEGSKPIHAGINLGLLMELIMTNFKWVVAMIEGTRICPVRPAHFTVVPLPYHSRAVWWYGTIGRFWYTLPSFAFTCMMSRCISGDVRVTSHTYVCCHEEQRASCHWNSSTASVSTYGNSERFTHNIG